MVELSKERIEQILHEETAKKEELDTILRSIYTRYRRMYEKYFADIDALNDDKIAELRKFHEETRSLVRYYYMDIPQDICTGLREFDNKYSANLLGPEWHKYLFDSFKSFKEENRGRNKSKEHLKAEFAKQTLTAFYEAMDYIFREGFGTADKTTENTLSEIIGKFFKDE